MSLSKRPVRLRQRLLNRLGVREWGLPSRMHIGKAWRSEVAQKVMMILPAPGGKCRVESRPVIVVQAAAEEYVPESWQTAARIYCLQWPDSAGDVAAFADLTRYERHEQIVRITASQLEWMQAREDDVRKLPIFLHVLGRQLAPWGGDYQIPAWDESKMGEE